LYNLKDDIGEAKNRFSEEPQKVKELATVLSDYLKYVNAQMPIDKRTGRPVEFPDALLQPDMDGAGLK
jgi:hypothetical protein